MQARPWQTLQTLLHIHATVIAEPRLRRPGHAAMDPESGQSRITSTSPVGDRHVTRRIQNGQGLFCLSCSASRVLSALFCLPSSVCLVLSAWFFLEPKAVHATTAAGDMLETSTYVPIYVYTHTYTLHMSVYTHTYTAAATTCSSRWRRPEAGALCMRKDELDAHSALAIAFSEVGHLLQLSHYRRQRHYAAAFSCLCYGVLHALTR